MWSGYCASEVRSPILHAPRHVDQFRHPSGFHRPARRIIVYTRAFRVSASSNSSRAEVVRRPHYLRRNFLMARFAFRRFAASPKAPCELRMIPVEPPRRDSGASEVDSPTPFRIPIVLRGGGFFPEFLNSRECIAVIASGTGR